MLRLNITSFNPHNSLGKQEQPCYLFNKAGGKLKLKVFTQLSQNSIVCGNQNHGLKPGLADF